MPFAPAPIVELASTREEPCEITFRPSNDDQAGLARVDASVMTLVRLIGRQIAREEVDRAAVAINSNGYGTEID